MISTSWRDRYASHYERSKEDGMAKCVVKIQVPLAEVDCKAVEGRTYRNESARNLLLMVAR